MTGVPTPYEAINTPFTLTVVTKNDAEVETWKSIDTSCVNDLRILRNAGGPGYGVVGQFYLDVHRAAHGNRGIYGIVHGDTYFEPGALERFAKVAREGNCAGIVGVTLDHHYVWCKADREPEWHNEGTTVRYGGGEVCCFDGCGIFFPVLDGFDFDPFTFDGHHCVVEDMCLNARLRGMKLIVPDAEGDHRASRASPEWYKSFVIERKKLLKKYDGKIEWRQC